MITTFSEYLTALESIALHGETAEIRKDITLFESEYLNTSE